MVIFPQQTVFVRGSDRTDHMRANSFTSTVTNGLSLFKKEYKVKSWVRLEYILTSCVASASFIVYRARRVLLQHKGSAVGMWSLTSTALQCWSLEMIMPYREFSLNENALSGLESEVHSVSDLCWDAAQSRLRCSSISLQLCNGSTVHIMKLLVAHTWKTILGTQPSISVGCCCSSTKCAKYQVP